MSRWHGLMPLIVVFLVSVLGPESPVCGQSAQSGGADTADPGKLLAQAEDAVAAACKSDAALHGAWVRFEADEEATTGFKFKARVLVDTDRQQEQLQHVQSLLDRLQLGYSPRIATPIYRAPLSQLIPRLQAAALSAIGKPGCYVRGLYYALETDQEGKVKKDQQGNVTMVVEPFGRTEDEEQWDAVVSCFERETSSAEWADFEAFASYTPRILRGQLAIRRASPRMVQAYRWLDEALATDPVLKGARVELAECLDHRDELSHFDVYQYVTDDRAEAQRAKLSQMLAERLGDSCQVRVDAAVPLVRLINRLNLVIESRPSLNGCWVEGAYFAGEYPQLPAPGKGHGTVAGPRQPKMVLYGQVADEQLGKQRAWIAELAGALVRLDPDWKHYAGEFATVADELAVVLPSPGRGQVLFGQGVTMFWNRRYEDAWRAFHYATLEMPESLAFRYWRILAEMQLGRTADAQDHLVAMVGRSSTPTAYLEVIKSLHRVQGPLRAELLRLESEARLLFYSRQHDMLFGHSESN